MFRVAVDMNEYKRLLHIICWVITFVDTRKDDNLKSIGPATIADAVANA